MTLDGKSFILPTKAEVVNDAIMSGQPALILEGSTDLQLYNAITSALEYKVVLRPVELVDGFGEGCEEVIRLLGEIEEAEDLRGYARKHVAGVIDKDVRDYRGQVPQCELVVILKYYSVESHYVSNFVLEKCLIESTYIPNGEKIANVSKMIFEDFAKGCDDLFLASVEALKGAVDENYTADYQYSDGYGRLRDSELIKRLEEKKDDLLEFADSLGLDRSIDCLKRFVKGKVILDAFCFSVRKSINSLHEKCRNHESFICDYCKSGFENKCCYKVKSGVSENSIKNSILSHNVFIDFEYIIKDFNDRFELAID